MDSEEKRIEEIKELIANPGRNNQGMDPGQKEWANMMIGAMNQMAGLSNDPQYQQGIANQYLGLLGNLQPQAEDENKRRNEAIEMIQLGQALGDEEMMAYGQNVLREFQGMDPMPTPGTDEYRQGVREDAYKSYFAGELPGETNELGDLTGQGLTGVEAQLQAEENPNLVKQYVAEEPSWFQRKKISGNPWQEAPWASGIQTLTGLPTATISAFLDKDPEKLQRERLARAGFKFD